MARSVLELAPILCAGCGQPFEPEDEEAVEASEFMPKACCLASWSSVTLLRRRQATLAWDLTLGG